MANSIDQDKRDRYARFVWQLLDRGSLTLLATLLKPRATPYLLKRFALTQLREIQQLRRALKRLAARKLVRIVEDLHEPRIELTESGKTALQKKRFENLSIAKPPQWDRVWRMVIFDIPEETRYIRDVLREKLQHLGFYQVQKSVFIHPYPCENEMQFLKQCLGADYHVHYFEFRIPQKRYEQHLMRHFAL